MLHFVIGLPCLFAEWCDRVAAELARKATGPTEIVHANTPEELTLGLVRAGAADAVVAARYPGGRLRSALVESKRNFIVALDDPRLALADLVVRKGMALPAAIQAVASGCAAMLGYASAPGALTLLAERASDELVATAIAKHLNLAVADAVIASIVQEQTIAGASGRSSDTESWWTALDADQRLSVDGALVGYLGSFTAGEPRPVTWTSGLFFVGDRPNERLAGSLDITGRARCLIQGPYIMLPPGSWLMSFRLIFSRATIDCDFRLEIFGGRQLASCSIRPTHEGQFEDRLTFTVDDAVDHPIVIRLSNERASFDGAITLVGLTLVPQPPPTPSP